MNREIKFRGRRLDNNEWVYGYYVVDPEGGHRIYWKPFDGASSNTYHFINPKTVGQLTGLKDKNGKEIYEGDCLFICPGYCSTVEFKDCGFVSVYKHPEDGEEIPLNEVVSGHTEVIGNIYETPSTETNKT